jgi:isopentenyl phosphate kinase
MIFLKLGGSLITDKARPEAARHDVLRRLAEEIVSARKEHPALRLLIGHGSGSFGHVAAARTRTHEGAATPQDWLGFAEVWRAANLLNRIVVDVLADAGLPVISFPPSASALARSGEVVGLAHEPIERALAHGLLPLVQGDVVFDEQRGSSIVSTERVFTWLTARLQPRRILLAGTDLGVFSDFPANQELMPTVSQDHLAEGAVGGSAAIDVTGGMADKVRSALDWARLDPDLEVLIFSGEIPGQLEAALRGESPGTRVVWRDDRD